jgi:Tfp pilus assembly protein PilE
LGQQQIILILLVTVIVAIATVLAVNTMQDSHRQANVEAIRQKMMEATTLAQAYYRKNASMGGGDGSYKHITLAYLNIAPDNELAVFSLSNAGDESFTLTAAPSAGGDSVVGVIYRDRMEFLE